MTKGRLIKDKNCNCNAKTIFWHTELNEPSSQEASILHRPVGLKFQSISLVTKVFIRKLSLTLVRMPSIWQMLVSRLMVVHIPVISKMKMKTAIGGNLLHEVAHGCKTVMFKATQEESSKRKNRCHKKETYHSKNRAWDELKHVFCWPGINPLSEDLNDIE